MGAGPSCAYATIAAIMPLIPGFATLLVCECAKVNDRLLALGTGSRLSAGATLMQGRAVYKCFRSPTWGLPLAATSPRGLARVSRDSFANRAAGQIVRGI